MVAVDISRRDDRAPREPAHDWARRERELMSA